MASVQSEDVKKWAEGAPVVQVQGAEQGLDEDPNLPSEVKNKQDDLSDDLEASDAQAPSFFQKLKGRLLGVEDKLKPGDAQLANNADPHPALSPAGAGLFSTGPNGLWAKTVGGTPKSELEPVSPKDILPDSDAPPGGESPVESEVTSEDNPLESQSSFRPNEKKGGSGDELGTGYEEDTEAGTLSSDSSLDLDEKKWSSPQSPKLFKPVEEEKDVSEMTLDDLRASKMSQNTSTDSVKAPGFVERATEEVEAVTDQLKESLNMNIDKRSNSGDEVVDASQGGFFSRIAEKMGYGHGRSQSQ